MKKKITLLAAVAVITLTLVIMITPATAAGPLVVDLIAGQDTNVGTVTVNDDGTNLTVTYEITEPGYCMDKTHLYVGTAAPNKAAPGKFPYSHTGLSCATMDSYTIPLSDFGVGSGEDLYVAAHADVLGESGGTTSGLADLVAAINSVSNPIQMTVDYATPGGPARWKITISGAGSLDGTYDGWCADPTNPFVQGQTYEADMSVSLVAPWTYVNYIIPISPIQ